MLLLITRYSSVHFITLREELRLIRRAERVATPRIRELPFQVCEIGVFSLSVLGGALCFVFCLVKECFGNQVLRESLPVAQ